MLGLLLTSVKDYSNKPPSDPDGHVSMHPALRVQHMEAGKSSLLSGSGELPFTVVCHPLTFITFAPSVCSKVQATTGLNPRQRF